MLNQTQQQAAICHECDLRLYIGEIRAGEKAACPRCSNVITRFHRDPIDRILVFSVTALICLFLSCIFNFISLGLQGQAVDISLFGAVSMLLYLGEWGLSLVLLVVVLILPVVIALMLGLLAVTIKLRQVSRVTIWLLRILDTLRFWNMAEIFFLGVLISMVKAMSLAEISFGISFYTYGLFSSFLVAALLHVDQFQLAQLIKTPAPGRDILIDAEEDEEPKVACHHCATVQKADRRRCSFCHSGLHRRKPKSLQRTWLFLITALVLYLPANLWPIMITVSLGETEPNTILSGVLELWEDGSYPIAIIIFVASVMVPIAKFFILFALCLSEQFHRFAKPQSKVMLYRVTEFIGRWSMVDVFVVAFLAALVQLGTVMTVYPGPAALAFAGMVVATMLASASFDPRLLWESDEQS